MALLSSEHTAPRCQFFDTTVAQTNNFCAITKKSLKLRLPTDLQTLVCSLFVRFSAGRPERFDPTVANTLTRLPTSGITQAHIFTTLPIVSASAIRNIYSH